MKTWPYCKEEVHSDAIKCRHCHSMLLSIEQPAKTSNEHNATYILDRGLIRFAKFAAAILAMFLVVGVYLFGFKIEMTLAKVNSLHEDMETAQEKMEATQGSIAVTQEELNTAQTVTKKLKVDVEQTLTEAQNLVDKISAQHIISIEIVNKMRNPTLTPLQEATQREVMERQPDKARTSVQGNLWQVGATIRIRFLNGNTADQEKVKTIASEWTKHANIKFQFVDIGKAEIRIKFDQGDGSWSHIGTQALGITGNQATMNLGWVERQNVLHEFGHALGLIEEHQNPNAKILWEKELLIQELSQAPNYWTRDMVEQKILKKYPANQLPPYRNFDPNSIMSYYLPPAFTSGAIIKGGEELSDSDKTFIAELYPK